MAEREKINSSDAGASPRTSGAEAIEALHRIRQWADAYPEKIFTPLTAGQIEKAGNILDAAGISIGALHAGWARHIVGGIGDIARAALAEKN